MPLRKRMNRLLTPHRDPRFIREFKAKYCVEVFAEHVPTKKKYVQCFSTLVKNMLTSCAFTGGNCGAVRTRGSLPTPTKSRPFHTFFEGVLTLNAYPSSILFLLFAPCWRRGVQKQEATVPKYVNTEFPYPVVDRLPRVRHSAFLPRWRAAAAHALWEVPSAERAPSSLR